MRPAFHSLRLMADDLTGALDSAVAFVRCFGPLDVGHAGSDNRSQVIDSATRESPARDILKRIRALAPTLAPAPGRLSFLKVDSLLRGHAGREIAALMSRNAYDHVIVAPALPAQGRATRNGRQVVAGQSAPTGEDIAATLLALGHEVHRRTAGDAPARDVSLFDAGSDADLDRIVAAGLALEGAVLWVGTGGLAAALGRAIGGGLAPDELLPPLPLLGLIGSDHPVMEAQLKRVSAWRVPVGEEESACSAANTLMRHQGAALLSCTLPLGMARADARRRIAACFARMLSDLKRPGTLFVSGGETLRGLLGPLGAHALRVQAEFLPGVPLSTLVGGRWDGVSVLSKSGAFGDPHLLQSLLDRLSPIRKDVLP